MALAMLTGFISCKETPDPEPDQGKKYALLSEKPDLPEQVLNYSNISLLGLGVQVRRLI